jgi:hypothetical protein
MRGHCAHRAYARRVSRDEHAFTQEDGTDGQLGVYLFMAGYWTITFTIADGTGASDQVIYSVCLTDGT